MKIISARERRAEKPVFTRTSSYNITADYLQDKEKMNAVADKLIRRRKILFDAGLCEDKTFVSVKAQTAYLARCDAAIEAAEKGTL